MVVSQVVCEKSTKNMPQQHVKLLGVLRFVILEMLWRKESEGSHCRLTRWEEQCLV